MVDSLLEFFGYMFALCFFVLPFVYIALKLFLILIGHGHIVKKWEGKRHGVIERVRVLDTDYPTPKDNYLDEVHNNPTYSHYVSNHYHNIYEQTHR